MRLIRASELGEHAFCRRAWWLRRARGLASANQPEMQAGSAHHASHGRLVGLAAGLRRLAWLLLAAAVLWLIVAWLA